MNDDTLLESGFSAEGRLEDAAARGAVEVAVETPPNETVSTSSQDATPSEERGIKPSEVSQLQDMLISLSDQLAELRRAFTTKIQFDESKQRQLDLMHQELEQHRQGMVTQIVRPVLMDLVSLHDDLAGVLEGNPDLTPQVSDMWRKQQQSIEGVLGKHGVDVYISPDDIFDRTRQRAVSVIDTSDEALDQRVARRRRVGFIYQGRTLRPEWVETFRYRGPAEQ